MTREVKIRILYKCSLGLHFLQVHNVVHYWVLKEFETFQQQMGRGWMDGWLDGKP